MQLSRPSIKRIGLIMFSIGVLLSFVLTVLMTWADIEAVSYGFPRLGNQPMEGLSCPLFMNRTENTNFSVTLTNTTERVLRPQVKVMVSENGLSRWRTTTTPASMEPGERKTLTWDVSDSDVVLNLFVFVKAYTFASYPMPETEGTCGIFVINAPWFRGEVLFWLLFGASLVCLSAGLWLSDFRKVEGEQVSGKELARKVLAVFAVLGLITGIVGWWPLGIIVLLVIMLTFLTTLLVGNKAL